MTKKNFTLLTFLSVILLSCTKQTVLRQKSELETLAYEILKKKMSSSDFKTLDWNSIREESLNGVPTLLKIKSKINPAQTLLFARSDNKTFYNWIELNITEKEKNIVSGTLVLKAIDNSFLNQFIITKNKIVRTDFPTRKQPSIATRTTDDPYIELPEVIVIGYRYTQPLNWWSLYWLFNMNNFWFNQYTQDAFLDPANGGDGGGSGVILPIEDLFPETAEIQQFENDYRKEMSAEEIEIFDSMSRGEQLKYLWNAKNALDRSQLLYPGTLHNGKGDAYRHAYFSALNSKSLGVALAKRLGDAHENKPNQPLLERTMDLRNNQIGRDLFVWLQQNGLDGHFFREALAIKLGQMMDNGELWHLKPLGPNGEIIPGMTILVPVNQ